jgi:signal-transduction protein with cAMP-binding, CBS, and nucleotidyltransferase domain
MTGPVRHRDELAAATAADRREYLEHGLRELDCRHCAGRVLVKKNSWAHTSIEWTADAVQRCDAFSPDTGCPQLHRSIEQAVTAGELRVPDG